MESPLTSKRSPAAHRVVIAGGGVAAVETLLALRANVDAVPFDVTMLAPDDVLTYRPAAIPEPFGRPPTRRYPLAAICHEVGATLRQDRLVAVDAERHVIETERGARIAYDTLIVAVGARQRHALPHATTLFVEDELDAVREIVRAIETGEARDVAFVVPGDVGWTLPLYEFALTAARRARELRRDDVRVTIVTPEDVPLAAFRGAGSAAVARLLDAAGVTVITSTYAHDYDGRTLTLVPGARHLDADRVATLPLLSGPAIPGLPSDPYGFVRADEHGRVPGLPDVYVVGDATTFPIKQGGLATQQADIVAALVARAAGGDVPEPSTRPRLRAILAAAGRPLYLQATITGGESVASSASEEPPWWPPNRIAARHLAPYLADQQQAAIAEPVGARPAGASPAPVATRSGRGAGGP